MNNFRYIIHPVTDLEQNCTLITCNETNKAAFIDPGGDAEALIDLVRREEHIVLEKILLTHGHWDHVGASTQIAEHFSVPIEGPHKDDKFWLDILYEQQRRRGLEHTSSVEPDRWLEDGDKVSVGNTEFQVIHCPGHTPGHVIYYQADKRWAQVGDVLFHGSIGRWDFPRGNHKDLVHSIREKLWPLGNDVQFVPGHGPMSTFGEERQTNPKIADYLFE